MPTLVNYEHWTPQQIKQSFANGVENRLSTIADYHLSSDCDSQDIDCDNWHLDPSHPQQHPGAKLVRVS